jgi:hypothetical protein
MPKIASALPGVDGGGGVRRTLSSAFTILALALSFAACGGSRAVLTAYRTEQQAQEHCPKDAVVWLDPQSGMFQLKGHGSYGFSGAGRYACRGEAERAGMRAMAN